ncbi:MAG: response regulator transcription factor [Firmicutes bacterium]|nr:response regulator transcription factor [Bacillota bacterium]
MSNGEDLILVVEDEPATRLLIYRTLTQAGYSVLEADSGEAALALCREHHPKLLVLDLLLPGLDGFAICRTLRSENDAVPILMLTVCKEDEDKIKGLELGADDYMTKPFNPREVLARVKAILRRTLTLQDAPLKHHGLSMHFQLQKCFKEDREIDLTPHEFQLLATLMQNAGKPISREELLEKVWGKNHHGTPKRLDVYIRRVREKVEDDPSEPTLIRTLWGFGYIFE